MLAWLDKHQVTLYLLAIACGIAGGLLPVLPDVVEPVVLPALALLLWATFSSIPLVSQAKTQNIAKEEYKTRGYFTGWILAGNFLLVPAIVALLLWLTPIQSELRFAAALVLLAPCIDYVIVFTGIAGGAASQLLRNTPLLLLIQAVAVPVYLWAFRALGLWDVPGLSLEALYASAVPIGVALAVIVIPLCVAWVAQKTGGAVARRNQGLSEATMVPLMILVLFSTVAANFGAVAPHAHALLPLAGTYTLFALIAGLTSFILIGKTVQQSILTEPQRTALTFSTVTRNALVVLPIGIALARVSSQSLMPIAIMTQTLVELLVMMAMVYLFKRIKTTDQQEHIHTAST